MSSTKDVWDAIDNKRDHSLSGWQFSCGLLGRVCPVRCDESLARLRNQVRVYPDDI